jgi:F1F0 ATPase subunit 2
MTQNLAPALALSAGILLGLAYFACLRLTAEQFAAGAGWAQPFLLTLARLAGAAAALALAARWGALPLLAGFAGFLLSRGIALRRARSIA